ncbi:hypothetical protein [Enterovirga aerilata]|uniref:Uncharacterized protein n=1 Tax=Enterovirga aerilata TaxID=2730920 RepID=A0A849IM90_9HYPH|nr:hypothetical protein [Enterovirga sp. DB1703]NNM75063.1 hypothetical protein [Enterovirga sp. DB1703]
MKGEQVSARKQVAPSKGENVVSLDSEEMQANTIARRLMREYFDAPPRARAVFDDLYAEVASGRAVAG